MVTRNQDPAPHHRISILVAFPGGYNTDTFHERLAQHVAGEYRARLNIPVLQEQLKIASPERSAIADRQWECQPTGVAICNLARKYEPILIHCKERKMTGEIVGPCLNILLQLR